MTGRATSLTEGETELSGLASDGRETGSSGRTGERETARFVLSELFENALRWSFGREVRALVERPEGLVVVTNLVPLARAGEVASELEQVTTGDALDRLIARAEQNAAGTRAGSGLGVLTLRADHGVGVSFRVSPAPGDEGWALVEVEARW